MKGIIFNIRRYSVHDGPGIRVTFFMKGCPLSCIWCHNPEGISPDIIKADRTDRIGDREFRSPDYVGKEYTASDLLSIVEKERIFIENSKGGVTFSGGEPLLQTNFLLEALGIFKYAGIHTAVDTSGYAPSVNLLKIIPQTDLFLFDIKHMDPAEHLRLTGVSNELIIENFRLISASGKDIMIRIPVIPGHNDDRENLERVKKLILSIDKKSLKRVNLLPFHKIGISKYKRFNMPYRMKDIVPPSSQRMKEIKEFYSDTGVKVKIGG
jgi:pyruvate formate lyase activating enzyme